MLANIRSYLTCVLLSCSTKSQFIEDSLLGEENFLHAILENPVISGLLETLSPRKEQSIHHELAKYCMKIGELQFEIDLQFFSQEY